MSKPNLDQFIPVPGRNQILAKHKFEFDEVIVPGMNPIRIPKYMVFPASIWNNLPMVSIDGKEYPKAGYVQTSREVEIAPDPPEAKKAAAHDTGISAKDDESATTEAAIRAGEKVTKAKMVQFVTDRKLDIESPSALPGAQLLEAIKQKLG